MIYAACEICNLYCAKTTSPGRSTCADNHKINGLKPTAAETAITEKFNTNLEAAKHLEIQSYPKNGNE